MVRDVQVQLRPQSNDNKFKFSQMVRNPFSLIVHRNMVIDCQKSIDSSFFFLCVYSIHNFCKSRKYVRRGVRFINVQVSSP